MRLILVRHGQTVCNTDNIWHGWDDCQLTDVGLAQAEAAAERLAAEPMAAIYTSDSRRALQTARAIAAPHGLDPIPDPAWRERNAGDFDGVAVDEVVARHPTVWDDRAADYWGWSPPNGESFHAVLERVLAAVDRLRSRHGEESVVAVTHMGPVRVLTSHFAQIPLAQTYRMSFASTGISIFSLDGDRPRLETLSDASHAL